MKKFFYFLMICCVLLSISNVAYAVETSANQEKPGAFAPEVSVMPRNPYRCEITANGVNVRSEPTTSSRSLGMMNKGDIVYSRRICFGEAVDGSDNEWHYVTCSNPNFGLEGYIYGKYIKYLE